MCAACPTPRLNQSYELRPPWEQHLRYVPHRVRNGYNTSVEWFIENQPLNTGDKSLNFRQEHNIHIGMTSLTKRNVTASFDVLLTVHLSIFIVFLTVQLSIFIVLLTVQLSIFIVLMIVRLSIFNVLLTMHLSIFIVLLTVISVYLSFF